MPARATGQRDGNGRQSRARLSRRRPAVGRVDPAGQEAARTGIGAFGSMRAGVSVTEAAHGIVSVANATMVRALNRVTVERGIDGSVPRPAGLRRRRPDARGRPGARFRHRARHRPGRVQRFFRRRLRHRRHAIRAAADRAHVERRVGRGPRRRLPDELVARLASPLLRPGIRPNRSNSSPFVAASATARQSYATEIADQRLDDPEALGDQFLDIVDAPVRFRDRRAVGALRAAAAPCPCRAASRSTPKRAPWQKFAACETRACSFGSAAPPETAVLSRSQLPPDANIDGPAIIEDEWSTIVVPPGATRGAGPPSRPSAYRCGRGAMSAVVDPFTLEVIRNALTSIAEEMSLVVSRPARSPCCARRATCPPP